MGGRGFMDCMPCISFAPDTSQAGAAADKHRILLTCFLVLSTGSAFRQAWLYRMHAKFELHLSAFEFTVPPLSCHSPDCVVQLLQKCCIILHAEVVMLHAEVSCLHCKRIFASSG